MKNKINCPTQPTFDAPIVASRKHNNRVNCIRKNRVPKKTRPYRVWEDEEDALLKKVYPHLGPSELQKLFPNRTPDAVDMRAYLLCVKKTPEYISSKNSANPSKVGLANFADHPVEALAQKYPDLKQAFDSIVACLMTNPAVDPSDTLQVELIKEAVLAKATQYIMTKDRIESGFKGKTLIFNPKTGSEQWVESRYLHGPDILNDAKQARTILKDFGIIQEGTKKVEVLSSLKRLWERESYRN